MSFKTLDTVVLAIDLPDHGLKAGELGTIVETYDHGRLDVEFVVASGETRAVVTLHENDVRRVGPEDMPSFSRLVAGSGGW